VKTAFTFLYFSSGVIRVIVAARTLSLYETIFALHPLKKWGHESSETSLF